MIDADPELGGALPGRVPVGEEKLSNAAGPYPPAYVVKKDPIVTGSMLKDAQLTFANGQPAVDFRFDEAGTHRLAAATTVNGGRQFAIVLDGKVIEAPVISDPITRGRGLISGGFTAQSAQELAMLLKSGPLPAPVAVVAEQRVAPRG
jgi:preprotein translocase subunit SecD